MSTLTLTANINVRVAATEALVEAIIQASGTAALTSNLSLADGTGAGQAHQAWADTRNLVATSENIDLFNPAASGDAVAQAMAFTRIVALMVRNNATTAGFVLLVGGLGTTAAWTGPFNGVNTSKLSIEPGGYILLVAPSAAAWPVTSSSLGHLLKIDAGANTVPYDILVIGS